MAPSTSCFKDQKGAGVFCINKSGFIIIRESGNNLIADGITLQGAAILWISFAGPPFMGPFLVPLLPLVLGLLTEDATVRSTNKYTSCYSSFTQAANQEENKNTPSVGSLTIFLNYYSRSENKLKKMKKKKCTFLINTKRSIILFRHNKFAEDISHNVAWSNILLQQV